VNFTHAAPYNGEAFLRPTLERRHFSCHADFTGLIRARFVKRPLFPETEKNPRYQKNPHYP
jgi:hypothetical protein